MLFTNPAASKVAYPSKLKGILSIEKAEECREWIAAWEGVNRGATPLRRLPKLAAQLGVGALYVKDEGERSELGSFKALGAPIALVRLILRRFPDAAFEPIKLFQGHHQSDVKDFTVISATDGNHGKSLAAAAQSVGCQCVIVLHANVSLEREHAIAQYGARIVRIAGNYDESVEEAARLGRTHGWEVVSDTSYEGYEEVPRDVMQGYGVISAEVAQELESQHLNGDAPFTHVFLQGGVGGLAAGVVSYFWERYGVKRPLVVVAEPSQADCLYQSAIAGRPSKATGTVDSVMAGLACGETSPLAWEFLSNGADAFLTVDDVAAMEAMRVLATGRYGDVPIVSGESGAAGLAALTDVMAVASAAVALGLDKSSKVLLINTEGATAPSIYKEIVGSTAAEVRSRQVAWEHGETV